MLHSDFDLYMMHLVVLTAIPTPYPAGRNVAPYHLLPTREQRTQVEETLMEVHSALLHDGMSPVQIEMLVRVGSAADELAFVARRRHIDCIVIGNKGHCPGQRFRRWLLGSTSRRVVNLAPCPALVTQHISHDPPNIVQFNAMVSPTLSTVVMHAFRRGYDKRYASMQDLLYDLQHLDSVTVVAYSANLPRIGGRYLQVMRIALIVLMECVCIVAFGLCAQFAHHLVW